MFKMVVCTGGIQPKKEISRTAKQCKWEYTDEKGNGLNERGRVLLFCPLPPVWTAICEREILRFFVDGPPPPMPPGEVGRP